MQNLPPDDPRTDPGDASARQLRREADGRQWTSAAQGWYPGPGGTEDDQQLVQGALRPPVEKDRRKLNQCHGLYKMKLLRFSFSRDSPIN